MIIISKSLNHRITSWFQILCPLNQRRDSWLEISIHCFEYWVVIQNLDSPSRKVEIRVGRLNHDSKSQFVRVGRLNHDLKYWFVRVGKLYPDSKFWFVWIKTWIAIHDLVSSKSENWIAIRVPHSSIGSNSMNFWPTIDRLDSNESDLEPNLYTPTSVINISQLVQFIGKSYFEAFNSLISFLSKRMIRMNQYVIWISTQYSDSSAKGYSHQHLELHCLISNFRVSITILDRSLLQKPVKCLEKNAWDVFW